jgi:predicted 3-demethylubiquinone-9 3-methyltransferase (glyoxalase superfamily)
MWDKLSAGGAVQQCGWLTDKFGVSWQVVPTTLGEMMRTGTDEQRERVMKAVLAMIKLDVATLKAAFDGK